MKNKILSLVPEHLKQLSELEKDFLKAVEIGQQADETDENIDVETDRIDPNKGIRSSIIQWVCSDPEVSQFVHPKGINLRGVIIENTLDLENVVFPHPFRLLNCVIKNRIKFNSAHLGLLDLSGCQINGISADFMTIDSYVFLNNGFHSIGEVRLVSANVGSLECVGGHFENPLGMAISAEGLTAKGPVLLRQGFHAQGGVRLYGARIGSLECEGGRFENLFGEALDADGLTTEGPVLLRHGFHAQGGVRLFRAKVGSLDCERGHFENPGGRALDAEGLTSEGPVLMRNGFHAQGNVRLLGAKIQSGFQCDEGLFENPGGEALNFEVSDIEGPVLLRRGFHAKGGVRLLGANIRLGLECDAGHFENLGGKALDAEGLTTEGPVFFRRGFHAQGGVRLTRAKVGSLECDGGLFENPGDEALNLGYLITQGSVFLRRGFHAQGEVHLYGANIGASLDLQKSILENEKGVCFDGSEMRVGGSLVWLDCDRRPKGFVYLRNSLVSTLIDDEASWPEDGNLVIDGFVYGPFPSGIVSDAKSRLKWLELQDFESRNVQSYEQLIRVFRSMGLDDDARRIAVAKQKFISEKQGFISKVFRRFLGITIDYGYRPEKVIFLFILPIILIGYFVFWQANEMDLMIRTNSPVQVVNDFGNATSSYPEFNPLAYSVDVFLPVIDLHQEDYWLPNNNLRDGDYILVYMWFHIIAGWLFTTLAVAAVTGLIRKD